MSAEMQVHEVVATIEAAWKLRRFDGLEACFHRDAVIVGPDYAEYARGRQACADSYREFATNAEVLAYAESGHALRLWESTAVHTFAWEMTYRREGGATRERGTDQQVFQRGADGWQLVWRYIHFAPAE